jgi:hypothetical protein
MVVLLKMSRGLRGVDEKLDLPSAFWYLISIDTSDKKL